LVRANDLLSDVIDALSVLNEQREMQFGNL
jgi:hypothetical protein